MLSSSLLHIWNILIINIKLQNYGSYRLMHTPKIDFIEAINNKILVESTFWNLYACMWKIRFTHPQMIYQFNLNSRPSELLTDMIICFTSLVSSIQSNAASKTKWEYWPCKNWKPGKVKKINSFLPFIPPMSHFIKVTNLRTVQHNINRMDKSYSEELPLLSGPSYLF